MTSIKNNRFIFSTDSIEKDFEQLQSGACIHYINSGQWSLHELLSWILKFTGPADVMVTSFSLSETAIRSFINLIDTGYIRSLKCLFDVSTKKNKFDLLMFAQNVSGKIYLNNNHAKFILVENDDHSVVVNSSANLTVNRRFEAGMIAADQELVTEFAKTIKEIFSQSIILNPDESI
jgi:hypothetical protein